MKLKLMAAMVAAVAACGGSKSPAPAPVTANVTPVAAGGTVELGELVFFEGNDPGMKIHADGRVEVKTRHSENGKPAVEEWKQMGSIGADGSVSHDGKVGGKFNADGTFTATSGETAPYKFDGEALVVADKKITIDDQGNVQGGNPEFKMRVEGAKTPGLRRTALAIFALMSIGHKEEHSEGGGY